MSEENINEKQKSEAWENKRKKAARLINLGSFLFEIFSVKPGRDALATLFAYQNFTIIF